MTQTDCKLACHSTSNKLKSGLSVAVMRLYTVPNPIQSHPIHIGTHKVQRALGTNQAHALDWRPPGSQKRSGTGVATVSQEKLKWSEGDVEIPVFIFKWPLSRIQFCRQRLPWFCRWVSEPRGRHRTGWARAFSQMRKTFVLCASLNVSDITWNIALLRD